MQYPRPAFAGLFCCRNLNWRFLLLKGQQEKLFPGSAGYAFGGREGFSFLIFSFFEGDF